MYRRLSIEILDDFNAALVAIQHALNDPYAPGVTLDELKKRVTTANDSFVAMVASEIWESVDSTIKCVNFALDLCEFIDHYDYPSDINANWHAKYSIAKRSMQCIYDKLNQISCREYALI